MERLFTDEEWEAFLECARCRWARGAYIHNEFEAKRQSEHPEVTDRDIANAMRSRAALVAYQDNDMERVALWDRHGRGLAVVATLEEGIITAYFADSFEESVHRTKTDIRTLREPT